jgi:hypothetical protein
MVIISPHEIFPVGSEYIQDHSLLKAGGPMFDVRLKDKGISLGNLYRLSINGKGKRAL